MNLLCDLEQALGHVLLRPCSGKWRAAAPSFWDIRGLWCGGVYKEGTRVPGMPWLLNKCHPGLAGFPLVTDSWPCSPCVWNNLCGSLATQGQLGSCVTFCCGHNRAHPPLQPLLSCWPATDDRALSTTPSTAESEFRSSVNYRVHAPAPGRSVVPPWAPRGATLPAFIRPAGQDGASPCPHARLGGSGAAKLLLPHLCALSSGRAGRTWQASWRRRFLSWPEESMT